MNSLEEVPFQILLGQLDELQGDKELVVTAPDITVPDYLQILRDTEYEFALENWVLTGLQSGYHRERHPRHQADSSRDFPSCPPYWMMFSSPQESRWASRCSSDLWVPIPRPRSHSLSSADTHQRQPRRVRFLISDSDHEAGYSEDDGGSSTEDNKPRPSKSRERPRNNKAKDPLSRVKELHNPTSHHTSCGSPRSLGLHKGNSLQECRQAPLCTPEQSQQISPFRRRRRVIGKRHQALVSIGRRNSSTSQACCFSPSRPQQDRPSSAGPVGRKHRQKALRTVGSKGLFLDSSAELLSALSQEEREILEAVTQKGYSLRTAIVALEKTGYRSPEKVLSYLVTCSHLCKMGYDEALVEEALEMFQNCESKAAEFLRLLTQFNEMGFQQSAIKEVLLVHENHRERALEDLMTNMA